jgi:hypothetical protein
MSKLGEMPRRLFQRVFHPSASKNPWTNGANALLDFRNDRPFEAEADPPPADEPEPNHSTAEPVARAPSANPNAAADTDRLALDTALTTARTLIDQGLIEIASEPWNKPGNGFPTGWNR